MASTPDSAPSEVRNDPGNRRSIRVSILVRLFREQHSVPQVSHGRASVRAGDSSEVMRETARKPRRSRLETRKENHMGLLRQMFGPSRQEIWRQLSGEIQGRYVEAGFCKGDKVQANHGEWTVTLDTYAVSTGKVVILFTRLRAPYVNSGGFRFTVYRGGMFSEVAKWFGMQDIQVGDALFDRDFVIKGTDEARVRELFHAPRIRKLVAAQREIHFTVKDDEGWFGATFPEGVDELYFTVPGVITDIERLKLLYEDRKSVV